MAKFQGAYKAGILQFAEARILVQPTSDGLGPFVFDLDPQLPDGISIATVAVKSFRYTTESTTDLIYSTALLSANRVSVHFKWPGTALVGNHKLTFEYDDGSNFNDEADFWCVVVQAV